MDPRASPEMNRQGSSGFSTMRALSSPCLSQLTSSWIMALSLLWSSCLQRIVSGFSSMATLPSDFARSPENFCGFFLQIFAWEICIERWRGFFVIFSWSPFPTKRSTKTPQKVRGKIRDEILKNLGNFRSATFPT